MNNTVRDHLYIALNNLLEKEFEEFKWWLKSIDYKGKENIPVARLEKANQLDVADFLIQYYEEDAVDVCINVLQKSNLNDIAKNLQEIEQKDYRNDIKRRIEKMKDPNVVPGEYVLLNQRYSKLIILDYHRSEDEKEDEILAMGRKHLEIISKRAKSSTSIETLFNPDKHGSIPQVVVLQGAAGIGKTMMAKKIMFDWASQQLYQDRFYYVFYISCREMNLHAETEKSSIEEIISKQWPKCYAVKNFIQNIRKNEEKILFIIDGFDEFGYSFDHPESYFCTKTWKKEPVRILLSSLFQKKLLPKSSLIITTRPTALEKLHRYLEYPRHCEILGFSTKEREEYFYNFFKNKDQAIQAFRLVEQNDTLFTMCVIPLVSWIICTVMEQEMERGKDLQKTPCTLTAIYIRYFSSLLQFHHKESKQDVKSYVKGLCSLAAEGIWNQKTLFLEEDVKEHILDQGVPLTLFLNQNLFKRDIDCIQIYSFIHLSFQEFFAAMFYVLEEGDEQHSQNWNKNLQTLLERHKSFKPNFAVGLHFLFGFLNEDKRMTRLKQKFGWQISPKNKEFLLDCVKNNFKKNRRNFQLQKEMFGYLYETQDENFVKYAVHDITEIIYQCNSDMDLMILSYCIQHCQNLEHLHVKVLEFLYPTETKYFLPENEEGSLDERYVEGLFKALTELRNLRELSLVGWSFTESYSRHLVEVFKNNQRLKVLQLSLDDTDDRAAELLCEGLQHADCKVETLVFTGESMTEFCSRHVAEVLCKSQSLRELKLWLHNPDDRVAEMLCVGLQNQDCRIEKLGIATEFLTNVCTRHLAEVIRENQRLREIEFSLKKIDGKITEVMNKGLKHAECLIEMLQLIGQVLIESNSRDPAEVLGTSEILRALALPVKDEFDKVIELILEILSYPDITLESIWYLLHFLLNCFDTEFPELLRKNQTLGELELLSKNPDDKAVELFLGGLKDFDYKMELIVLTIQFLSTSCVKHLAERLKKKQRFRDLDSLVNNTVDKVLELLLEEFKDPEYTKEAAWDVGYFPNECCSNLLELVRENHGFREVQKLLKNAIAKFIELLLEVFKDPECTKERVQNVGQFLNEFCSVLRKGFSKHQELNEMELFLNSMNDQTMELLCEGLKDPECKIETLRLLGKIPNEYCSRLFVEVLKKNQRLRVLMLSLKNSDDTAMEQLYDGLKHSECTIESLQLFGGILTDSCRRHLGEVFRKNPTCKELKLSFKNLDEKTMVVLCDGLKDPESTIEMLQLDGEILSESCSRQLVVVARKNQRMNVLCLSFKNPDNKTMEVLCDALKHSECTIKSLQLAGDILTESCIRHLAEVFWKNQRLRELKLFLQNPDDKILELLCDSLKHPKCKIETLLLDGEFLTESCSKHLAEVLRTNQRLRVLHLSLKNPDDITMEGLCEGLKHSECRIETLEVVGEILTESYSRHLAEVYRKNQRLRELKLSLKNPDEKTMEVLCDELKYPECKIETLELDGEILSESNSRQLAVVVRKKQGKNMLSLSLKNPDDKTMEVLCGVLEPPKCTIETLQLAGDILTDSCSRHLAKVLRKKQNLGILFLSLKDPEDKTMEMLCDVLKHSECTIEMLQVVGEVLAESCSRHLVEVFRKNQRLRVLYWSLKNQDDKAMEVLCEGLKHPECTIEMLQLDGGILTESCSRHLAKVLKENHRLNVLYLSLKNPDDKAMEALCEGLKHPKCTIEILQLAGVILTESCRKHLEEVLRENHKLNVLHLYLENADDETVEVLCEGLKHSECTIERLQLVGEILTDSCSRNLAQVFKKNVRLRELKLSLKNPDEKTMELLCEGLKYPECNIETLLFTGEILTEPCSWHLAQVLKTNQRLKRLYLSLQNPDDRTMELLCDGIKHPGCAIKKLQLAGEFLTESCSRYLAEVLRKNQRLRKLELSIKNPDDKTMKLLCEGFKDPQCKLETLQLNGKCILQNGKWMDANYTIFLVNFFCFFMLACLIYFYFR
ncbi:NACHT, LRR and PYD domains-containing protein 12-like isoform X2 [Thamnophis elegans]|uniref:NACHT, LRR and PYD domains-containing protein 12-like isoform X2 n=1 Tax=Thamnophis elegans TaxID=35005 RepID=UPI001378DA0B|nr:NACHT, LRR and PYD domains-containing protein 12-like isoform X2 [Thamnophis elegans]